MLLAAGERYTCAGCSVAGAQHLDPVIYRGSSEPGIEGGGRTRTEAEGCVENDRVWQSQAGFGPQCCPTQRCVMVNLGVF